MYKLLIAYVSIAFVLGPMFALSPKLDWSYVNSNYSTGYNTWLHKAAASISAGIVWPFLIKNMW